MQLLRNFPFRRGKESPKDNRIYPEKRPSTEGPYHSDWTFTKLICVHL